ncbi:MAG: tetratricopeptide repeat protein [Candidatus Binataceae bacterium]
MAIESKPVSEVDQKKLTEAATAIAAKAIRDLSEDELKVRIGAASASKDWRGTRDLGVALRGLFTGDSAQAHGLFAEGFALGQLGEPAAAIAAYDEVVRRFGDSAEPALREPVAMALVNKGATQGQRGEPDAAIATYDEVVRRFGDSAEPALREQVAKALVNKGFTQGRSGDPNAAIAAYDEVVRRFGDSAEPALRERVAMARKLRASLS